MPNRRAESMSSHGSFVSDVLHKLSQPLTALHCSLELSLVRDQTSEEFRASVEAALQNAERLRQNLLLLRELSDADDPGDISAPVQLQELLQEARQDFLPVCESAGGFFTSVAVRCRFEATEPSCGEPSFICWNTCCAALSREASVLLSSMRRDESRSE